MWTNARQVRLYVTRTLHVVTMLAPIHVNVAVVLQVMDIPVRVRTLQMHKFLMLSYIVIEVARPY